LSDFVRIVDDHARPPSPDDDSRRASRTCRQCDSAMADTDTCECAQIWVELDTKSALVSGDSVSGTVFIDCVVPFLIRTVSVKFKGLERVRMARVCTRRACISVAVSLGTIVCAGEMGGACA
jgi:hypothetical protein